MPDPLQHIAKLMITFGIMIAVIGALILLFRNSGIPFPGRLPGDIMIQKKNFTFYFPLATSIVISIILSLLVYLFTRK